MSGGLPGPSSSGSGSARRAREAEVSTDTCDDCVPPSRKTSRLESVAPPQSAGSINPFTKRPYSSKHCDLMKTRAALPVFQNRQLIVNTVARHPVTIIVGETGSGKTTQIPQFLAEVYAEGQGRVVCTQPRRVAAVSVAARVAEEMDVRLGEEVGYHVRFQPMMDAVRTRVLYMTDGMLLRECMSDPLLPAVRVVMVDEVHERTKSTDVALGLLKGILNKREDFRVVAMSATLDVGKLTAFFPDAPVLKLSGRVFPVEVSYIPSPITHYVKAAVEWSIRLHVQEPEGDILCFLTGEKEICEAVNSANAALRNTETANRHGICSFAVLPLYGALPLAEQQKVFSRLPPGTRKIVFTTNIAETSVTVDGVVYVIDCCYQKQTLYNAGVRVEYLLPAVISKASAEQRRGRAGRTRPGKCLRLVPETDYDKFPEQTFPEMLRTSILDVVLLLLEVGVENPCQFEFLDPPSDESVNDAFFQLLLLGIVNEELQLTPLGKRMAALPVGAPAARMLVKAEDHHCAADAAVIVAMSEGGIIRRGGRQGTLSSFSHPDGDHLTNFFIFHDVLKHNKSEEYCLAHQIRYQSMTAAFNVYAQLRRQLEKMNVPFVSLYKERERSIDSVALRKALLEGIFLQVAYLVAPEQQLYRTVCDSVEARIHRDSVLQQRVGGLPPWVMYERLEVQGEDGVWMRTVTAVEVDWLLDVSDFYRSGEDIADRDIAFALEQAKNVRSKI